MSLKSTNKYLVLWCSLYGSSSSSSISNIENLQYKPSGGEKRSIVEQNFAKAILFATSCSNTKPTGDFAGNWFWELSGQLFVYQRVCLDTHNQMTQTVSLPGSFYSQTPCVPYCRWKILLTKYSKWTSRIMQVGLNKYLPCRNFTRTGFCKITGDRGLKHIQVQVLFLVCLSFVAAFTDWLANKLDFSKSVFFWGGLVSNSRELYQDCFWGWRSREQRLCDRFVINLQLDESVYFHFLNPDRCSLRVFAPHSSWWWDVFCRMLLSRAWHLTSSGASWERASGLLSPPISTRKQNRASPFCWPWTMLVHHKTYL